MKIEVKHLSFRVADKQILTDVNACFEGNRIIGIIGPNGSGKTTLLRHIYRQLPSRNAVFMDGRDISTIPARLCAQKVAVMMQHQDLFESDLKVYETVQTGRYPYKELFSGYDEEDDRIVTEILRQHSLLEYRNRKLSTLSGGELQRVMICRCLAQQPEAIILDEPTNHLDIRYKLELMKTLRSFGGLVLMTLHDLNLAAGFCEELFVMKEGKIIRQGAPEEVLSRDMLQDVFEAEVPVYKENGTVIIGV